MNVPYRERLVDGPHEFLDDIWTDCLTMFCPIMSCCYFWFNVSERANRKAQESHPEAMNV